jgi:hypothetical protein
MTRADLIACVTAEAARLAQVRALFLGGSYGRGSADSFGNVDLIALVDAHIAIARAFFPLARALASRLGIAWPDEFEAATRRHLQTAFGAETEISW